MARQAKTQRIIDEAKDILTSFHPMTVRQVYYQLVSRQRRKQSVSLSGRFGRSGRCQTRKPHPLGLDRRSVATPPDLWGLQQPGAICQVRAI